MICRGRLAPIVLLAACGRIGFESELPPDEPCDWTDALYFQSIEPLAAINTDARESAPFVSSDGQALYFSTDQTGTDDFFTAETSSPGLFSEPRRFERLASESADSALSFAVDHLEVVYASDRAGGSFDLFRGRRPSQSAQFVDQDALEVVNTDGDELSPHLAESDLALYFASGASGALDLYVARRANVEAGFGAPKRLDELSSDADDLAPALTDDGRVIVFASSRSGTMDLYYATRDSVDEPFGAPEALEGLNTEGIDTDPFITRDGCFLYFASDRDGGELDLYLVRAFE